MENQSKSTQKRIAELNEKIEAIWEQQRLAATLLGYPKSQVETAISDLKTELTALDEICTILEKHKLHSSQVQDITTYLAMAFGVNRNIKTSKIDLVASYLEKSNLEQQVTKPVVQADPNPRF